MIGTIEPRLIALLNEGSVEAFATLPSLELPPLQNSSILKASGRPLLLEPDADACKNKKSSGSQLASHLGILTSSAEEEETLCQDSDSSSAQQKQLSPGERALGSSSPQALRKILDDDAGIVTISTRKRRSADVGKDDFVQLPQPPEKRKAVQQVVPPIIIGLLEPPPQSTIFPPIASSSFHDRHGRNSLNIISPNADGPKDDTRLPKVPDVEVRRRTHTLARRREARTRRKWTEYETRQLLLGVHKHGVGKWTDIRGDPEFDFDDRSGVDLKDRFRTCCPIELRTAAAKPGSQKAASDIDEKEAITPKQMEPRFSMNVQRIIEGHNQCALQALPSEVCDASSAKARKSRAHRKSLTDLAKLGIDGPFRKSQRRERRPFTNEDDREIVEGYKIYGPAWSRIRRDTRFHLQNRQPTDLRDRFRNKFTDKFKSVEHTGTGLLRSEKEQQQEINNEFATISSSIHQTTSRERLSIPHISTSVIFSPATVNNVHYATSKPSSGDPIGSISDSSGAEAHDGLSFSQSSFDWAEGANAPFASSIGEMDIARLLLDETWVENAAPHFVSKHRPTYTGVNSLLSSSVDVSNHSPYFNILAYNSDQMVGLSGAHALNQEAALKK